MSYEQWIQSKIQLRKSEYSCTPQKGQLSFITTIWNTPEKYLEVLLESMQAQEGGISFQWVVLDNGSKEEETLRFIRKIEEFPWVKILRVPENVGIINGMKLVLDAADGEYVLPLDSDDYIFPDCVRIFTWHIQNFNSPPALYSDEDKCNEKGHFAPYIKTDWDPVLFLNSCYIAHLCAIKKSVALEVGAYSDNNVNGSHDWDSFSRMLAKGYTPVHVPEVLYSWRVHETSTAQNIDSKSYIHESQFNVLERYRKSTPNSERYYIEYSPLFSGTPDWWFRRRKVDVPSVLLAALSDKDTLQPLRPHRVEELRGTFPVTSAIEISKRTLVSDLKQMLAQIHNEESYIAFCELDLEIIEPEWIWEAITLFEMHPDTEMVGGRISNESGVLVSSPGYFGFDKGVGQPNTGSPVTDPGYFAFNWKQRSVDAVPLHFSVVSVRALKALFKTLNQIENVQPEYLGEWLAADIKKRSGRVVYSPYLHGRMRGSELRKRSVEEESRILAQVNQCKEPPPVSLMPADLSRTKEQAFQPRELT